ncbi:hypothetical protein [Arthrobacter sp. zg-Y1110]|uniref:hypothetical protein n=1 Tax=Arthrobacter sp. zg-Y1110 TaxID=2886932 RepID=UPI001D15E353|nr:hypothetical protein [Arthrobacter sp. zg-Y1110]MCC3292459.1 hypothetical protein [Arthrobacter sp. zg-Y1110]UWX87108.1 hypothetical protein N2K99_17320 [Arthrobacter sp. zg-Y1110]
MKSEDLNLSTAHYKALIPERAPLGVGERVVFVKDYTIYDGRVSALNGDSATVVRVLPGQTAIEVKMDVPRQPDYATQFTSRDHLAPER